MPPVPSRPVRILVVAEAYPWPAIDGYRQRLAHMITGLTVAGTVDVFALVDRHGEEAPPGLPGLGRVVSAPRHDRGVSGWLGEWLGGDRPRRVLEFDWTEAHRELAAWGPQVDLVWYSHIDAWVATSDLFAGVPAIVDFDNLENLMLRLRRRSGPQLAGSQAISERLGVIGRWGISRAFDIVDERRWTRLQQRCGAAVDRVVVCSELDAQRSGLGNAVVIPNGSNEVHGAVTDRRLLRGDHPRMIFVGALDYEPNADAVRWFVTEVLPLVRRRLPGARLAVVGRGSDMLGLPGQVPGLEVVGEVADLGPELLAADISVVPIRLGAGTRLKVVEAMANHLPMVTTTVGCEGIALRDGTHALVADDPRRFADRCLRMLTDGTIRQELADNAAQLFSDRYRWSSVEAKVSELAREVAGDAP